MQLQIEFIFVQTFLIQRRWSFLCLFHPADYIFIVTVCPSTFPNWPPVPHKQPEMLNKLTLLSHLLKQWNIETYWQWQKLGNGFSSLSLQSDLLWMAVFGSSDINNHGFFFFLSTSLIPCRKFGLPYLGKATAAARAALPIPNSACSIFVCPNKGMAASAWDL